MRGQGRRVAVIRLIVAVALWGSSVIALKLVFAGVALSQWRTAPPLPAGVLD